MKLLYITTTLPFGAGEAFFIPEVDELRRQGHELLIVPRSPEGQVIVNRDAEGLPAITVRRPVISPGILIAAIRELFTHPVVSLHALATLFKSQNLWTLVKNLAVFPKGLWLARLARRWKADHIHAQWALTTATMAMVAGDLSGTPWSFTAHRGDIADDNLLAIKVDRASFARFISASGAEMAESLGAQAVGTNGVIIHMGVDLPTGALPDHEGAFPRIVLCAANLFPVKGHKHLLQAMAILKRRGVECRLDIAGEGYLRGELENLVRELSIDDRVRFVGQLAHEELLTILQERRAGLMVLPSVDLANNLHEGIPVALMEAMARGIPVISTETGGIPELLHDGAGILVPPADATALADAIDQVLSDSELRERLIRSGRSRVEEQFCVKTAIAELVACMQAKHG